MSDNQDPQNFFDDLDMDAEDSRPEPFAIKKILSILNDSEKQSVLPAGVVYGLSTLSEASLHELQKGWPEVPAERRRKTVSFLAELSETNFDLDFHGLAYLAMKDSDADVRAKAIELLWFDTSEKLFAELMRLSHDEVSDVRAAAMAALGRFIYATEMEEFDEEKVAPAKELAIQRFHDVEEDLTVRRRSLEAIANSSHPRVNGLIDDAYYHADPMMRASALFAMGASCDSERWEDIVVEELLNSDPRILFEAVRAAGELSLERAVPDLIELSQSPDYEIKTMAIWSLGQIATKDARQALGELSAAADANADVDLLLVIEEALEYSALNSGLMFPMFEFFEEDVIFDEDDASLDDKDEE